MCSSELEIMNTKFRDCAGRLNEEEQKNDVLFNDYALLQERLEKLEFEHKEKVAENMRLKIGLKSAEDENSKVLDRQMVKVSSHRRIFSESQQPVLMGGDASHDFSSKLVGISAVGHHEDTIQARKNLTPPPQLMRNAP